MEWPSPSCPKKPSLDSFKSNLKICNFPKQQTCHVFPLHAATFHPCLLSVVGCKLCKVSILMRACACVCVYALRTVSLNKTLCYRNTLLLQNYLLFSVTISSTCIIIFIWRRQLAAFLLAGLCGRWFLLVLLTRTQGWDFTDNWSWRWSVWGEQINTDKTLTWKTKQWPERWAILSPQGHQHSFITQQVFTNLCRKVTKTHS